MYNLDYHTITDKSYVRKCTFLPRKDISFYSNEKHFLAFTITNNTIM